MASQWLRQGTRGAALAEQFASATVGMRVEHSRARVGEVTSVGDGEHLVTWRTARNRSGRRAASRRGTPPAPRGAYAGVAGAGTAGESKKSVQKISYFW